jgi:hypothetical protein
VLEIELWSFTLPEESAKVLHIHLTISFRILMTWARSLNCDWR